MERYYILKDDCIIAITATREEALHLIEQRKARETHWLKSEFSIIRGTQEFIK